MTLLVVTFEATFAFENLATMALAVNLVTYFTGTMHFGVSDAANQLTNFMGSSYILSIFVATFADAYIGRYRAVLISGSIEFLVRTCHTIQYTGDWNLAKKPVV